MDLPEVTDMRQRCSRKAPPRQITVPTRRGNSTIDLLMYENRKTISELLVAKWELGAYDKNKIMCRATANRMLIEDGWYYWGCSSCKTKVVGEEGDRWCTKCEAKMEEPIPRCCYISICDKPCIH
ncbi:hypothetical protein MKW94_019455 [Papaver nudicaule]|uniref:Replication factor A C-terminal domain-containing protein n=1 Tax=Papaver nudicaule TaxID=74823 RepID=A0AA41VT33_PAPNU|nr:hypothetical protein [Papaver nudicaule]